MTSFVYDLFISYADADSAWVKGYLLDTLTEAGINCHSEAAFTLGAPRVMEFERAVQQSRRILLIISPAYLADGSSRFIDLLAQTHGLDSATWPVIPLKLSPVAMPSRLAILTGLDATNPANWQEVIERLCSEFQRALPAPIPRPECPYPGMRAFDESESHLFFGRDIEIQELKNELRLHPFTVVIGPSGSGKSSVVFAGLIPELRRTELFGAGTWVVRSMRPGQTPTTTLEALLEGVSLDPKQAVAKGISAESSARRLLLVIDQFEELFTLGGDEGLSFQKRLLSLVGVPDLYLVLTARADFYSDLMASLLWSQIRLHRHEVVPLGEDELRQSILKPAEKVNVLVESALVERMVADAAGEPGILPFVQETMRLLWEHVERRLLPLRAYEALVLPRKAYASLGGDSRNLSGLQVAIALHADVALKTLDEQEQTIARRIFLRLVQFGEGRADTRRQQPVVELRSSDDDPMVFAATLRHLAGKRLLTLSGEENEPGTKVDIAHEALISGWYTLREWISNRREMELTRRRLEAKAKEWIRFGEGEGGLLDETELAEADRYVQSPDAADLGSDVALKKLLARSRSAILERQTAQEEARKRELTLEVAARRAAQIRNRVALVLLTMLAGLTIFAFIQRNRAQKSEHDVKKQSVFNLSRLSQLYLASDQQLEALTAALKAGQRLKDQEWGQAEQPIEAILALQQAVNLVRERNRFHGHLAGVTSVSLSPDGKLITTGGNDKTVRLWHAVGSLVGTFTGHLKEVTEVAFSPNGQSIASTGFDRTIRFWDLQGRTLRIITVGDPNNDQDGNWISSIAFSPDGQKIAAACADQTVRLWELPHAEAPPRIFTGHRGKVIEVRFIPHGDLLASAGEDGDVIVWNLNGDKQRTISTQSGTVFGLDVSPDGQTIATAGEDKSVKLWALDGTFKKTLGEHDDSVVNVRFSPDGQTVASVGKEGAVRLFSLADSSVHTLRGHHGAVSVVRFSNDSKTILSAGDDGTVRLWSVTSELAVLKHKAAINNIRFSPEGQMLVTASDDQSIGLWRLDGSLLRQLSGNTGAVMSIGISPDSRQLVSGGEDKKVRLWDLNGGVRVLGEHSGLIRAVSFSPDGRTVASAGAEKAIKLWNLNGELLRAIDNRGEVTSIGFSPDGQTIATAGSDKAVKLWNLNGALLQTLDGAEDVVLAIRFNADGNFLAAGSSDNTVRLWRRNGEKFEPQSVLHGHGKSVSSISFSPIANYLASASNDGTIKFWSLDGQLLQTVRGSSSEILDISFSGDGKTFAFCDISGRAEIWNLDLDSLLTRGCGLIKDYLTTNPTLADTERHICDAAGSSGPDTSP